ncbi:isopentenyl-diphosphate Delta-isomerase [Mucilaginibacter pedocola]|uniref:Isopentenyl-diphosphate delta-isomerase n=1 Tax=Mucilaginibacter pedocola TaxID=1792845 RepID=A0A1S9PHA1_9SPHI|nr:isopentenyl-diphosphate Delta-isomerase [Mucilaginibacter pedocola]OOQ60344.1 isopentenyl-diphosphate delta-isomerase [Mucilaginibacter pedocola]
MKNSVMLVNEHDQMYGTMDKLAAHRTGKLHRAISVFIFNNKGEMLIQQRAAGKYHSGMLWSNACCSHPYLGEAASAAANRRLHEEMGISTYLHFAFTFIYKAEVGASLTEHEFDHVFIGICDIDPIINHLEVADFNYIPLALLELDIQKHPEYYTEWFKICFPQAVASYNKLSAPSA